VNTFIRPRAENIKYRIKITRQKLEINHTPEYRDSPASGLEEEQTHYIIVKRGVVYRLFKKDSPTGTYIPLAK
jgi:hypothetical protein